MPETAPIALPPIVLQGRTWFVIDKPAGLAVHPGPSTPESLEDLLTGYAPGRPAPQPVHRLDRDTSGCLLVARRKSSLRALSLSFATGLVQKRYLAVVENPPMADAGLVAAPMLKQSSAQAGWRMVVDARGKAARTHWEVLERNAGFALIRFRPETGRTHQIRVHANLLAPNSAIVGDPVYGAAHPGGMMLHAHTLAFPDPQSGTTQTAEAPCPDRFKPFGFPGTSEMPTPGPSS